MLWENWPLGSGVTCANAAMLLVGPIIIIVTGVLGSDSLKVPTFPEIIILSPSL